MSQFTDRRRNQGRRAGDLRNTQLLRAVGADLTHLRREVESARTDRDVPATLRRRLELIDRELSRLARMTDAATEPPEPTETHRLAAGLTQREWQCLGLMVHGLNTRAMAERLTVSDATVRTHVQSVLAKLGVNSRLEAVALTVRDGLVPPSPPELGLPA
ncbi:helix-turn-helix transcriptional regulator [Actinophytocola oryzae]|uniref:Regulatory LuxR family protein n=1 Tax=Actinophytocola oryzae TaxID=502181 RepID=A0A4R7V647_9PSEU|nr:LuxR C-terminal-related transcriptional regulator [Actinophytocola oryzae]TDV44294.1 regulatory LuxR family protein [Actinophytocola oryzae]